MGTKTHIQWTNATWNPLRGCSIAGPDCTNCYAMNLALRFSGEGQTFEGLAVKTAAGARWTNKIMLVEDKLVDPISWQEPKMIFVNSVSDLFHKDVPELFIAAVFGVMALACHHTYQVLTKRPERAAELMSRLTLDDCMEATLSYNIAVTRGQSKVINSHLPSGSSFAQGSTAPLWPLPNVWMGTSAGNQSTAEERIPHLLRTPARLRWLSAEPLIGPINLNDPDYLGLHALGCGKAHCQCGARMLDWVVCGGESGPHARPMHPDWARSLRDQCVETSIPFFFKQWGAWSPVNEPWKQENPAECTNNEQFLNSNGGHGFHGENVWRMRKVKKEAAGRLLDGREWNEYPEVRL